jgi:hypothetical protein
MPNPAHPKRKPHSQLKAARDLEIRILQNFVGFPGAANSIDGIAAAWLGGEDASRVSRALDQLIDSGAVGRLGHGESAMFFAIDPIKTEQMLASYELAGPSA